MSSELNEYEQTVLRMVGAADLGIEKTGHFRRYEHIVDEFGGNSEIVDNAIDALSQRFFVRDARPKFEKVHGYPLGYAAYQITELGRNYLASKPPQIASLHLGNNVNFAYNSPNTTQTINIDNLDPELQGKIKQLENAIKHRDSNSIKKVFGYIADKSIDVAIAILTGSLIK